MVDVNRLSESTPPFPVECLVNDGWYFFRDGAIGGPELLDEIHRDGNASSDGSEVLVSRPGFSQWYRLDEVADLMAAHLAYQREASSGIEQLQQSIAADLKNLAQHYPSSEESPEHNPEPAPAPSEKREVAKAQAVPPASTVERGLAEETIARATTRAPAPTKRLSRKAAKALAKKTAKEQAKAASKVAPKPQPAAQAPQNAAPEFWSYYMQMRGRLRLGRIQNSLAAGFVKFPLTLGAFWYFWIRTAIYEMVFHISGQYERKGVVPPFPLALVPGLHVYYAYRLARMVQFAENRIGYNATSPLMAGVLSIIPPVGIAYLQNATNRYWRRTLATTLRSST